MRGTGVDTAVVRCEGGTGVTLKMHVQQTDLEPRLNAWHSIQVTEHGAREARG